MVFLIRLLVFLNFVASCFDFPQEPAGISELPEEDASEIVSV
jgi:hypothetical protein